MRHEIARFILVGGGVTILSWAVYFLTVPFLSFLAYPAAYAFGLVLSYLGNRHVVFRRSVGRRWRGYALLHLAIACLGTGAEHAVKLATGSPIILVGAVSCLVIPVSFLMNRWFFTVTGRPG